MAQQKKSGNSRARAASLYFDLPRQPTSQPHDLKTSIGWRNFLNFLILHGSYFDALQCFVNVTGIIYWKFFRRINIEVEIMHNWHTIFIVANAFVSFKINVIILCAQSIKSNYLGNIYWFLIYRNCWLSILPTRGEHRLTARLTVYLHSDSQSMRRGTLVNQHNLEKFGNHWLRLQPSVGL